MFNKKSMFAKICKFFIEKTLIISCVFLIIVVTTNCEDTSVPVIVSKTGEITLDLSTAEEFVFSTSPISLSARLIPKIKFLEHVYNWNEQKSSDKVIVCDYPAGNIYFSDNLGEEFNLVYSGQNEHWRGCFTTSTGRHILWDLDKQELSLFDKNWNKIKIIKTGEHVWLGTFSISEMYGTILYAEYACEGDYVNVWRSQDDGDSWEKVFTLRGKLKPVSDVRHFHTVLPDPFQPSTWYLSSGDIPRDCRIWKSESNGTNWVEVTDPEPAGLPTQSMHRFTSMHFSNDYIYWATDDLTDGTAKFVRARRGNPLEVEVISDLGNIVQTMVANENGYVFISEQKRMKNNKYLDLTIHSTFDRITSTEIFRSDVNPTKGTGFTFSRSSIATKNKKFFSHYYGEIFFKSKYGLLIWEITE